MVPDIMVTVCLLKSVSYELKGGGREGKVYKPSYITSLSLFAPFYIKLDHGGGKVYKPACITSSSFFAPFYIKLDHGGGGLQTCMYNFFIILCTILHKAGS